MPYKDPEARRAYHVLNREKAKERVRKWREVNPEKARAQKEKRAALHSRRDNDYQREWRKANAESVRVYEQARPYDPAKAREYRQRREERLRKRRDADTRDYVAILVLDPCSYCNGEATGVDHVVPLFSDGTDHWENFTACCVRCNRSKNALALLPWLARR